MDLTIIIVLGLVILYLGAMNYIDRERYHKKESELLNRLMAKDYTDYTTNQVYSQQHIQQNTEQSIEAIADEMLKREMQGLPVG